jgi:hypothetical protein
MMLDDMKNLDMEKANPQITHKTPIKSTRRDADNTPSTIVSTWLYSSTNAYEISPVLFSLY